MYNVERLRLKMFLTVDGKWTKDVTKARTFETLDEAADVARDLRRTVEWVWWGVHSPPPPPPPRTPEEIAEGEAFLAYLRGE